MAIEPDPIQERASREATDWLILLQDEPDDPDLRRDFDDWLRRTPANTAAWAATKRVSSMIAATAPAHAGRWGAFAQVPEDVQKAMPVDRLRNPCPPLRRHGRRLAALALAACLALLFLPGLMLRVQSDYVTGTAEIRSVRLDDGSTVVMAPESAIAVDYGSGDRRVRLLAGEAFFEVVADPGRPFRVVTRDVRTTVLGTAFDIRRSAEGAMVAVEHGVVRVSHKGTSLPVSERLQAGQAVRITWAGTVKRAEAPTARVAPWRLRQLVAQDQPMRELVERVRPYFAGTIVLADATLADRPVTGLFNLSDPVDALRAIARAHGGSVHRITPWVLVVTGP